MKSSRIFKYHFYLTDHQGNIRVVASQNGEVEQVNHYYPYGGLMGESIGSDAPTKQDIKTAVGTEYVIGMGSGLIYKYNQCGVFATIPLMIFK